MPSWLKDWWPLIALTMPLLIAVGGWIIRMGLASRKDMEKGKKDLEDDLATEARIRSEALSRLDEKVSTNLIALDRRLLSVEQEIQHLPTADDIADLKNQVSRVEERGEAMARELQSITRALTRVEDRLMKGTGA
jgi:chromosome segregation ATPase